MKVVSSICITYFYKVDSISAYCCHPWAEAPQTATLLIFTSQNRPLLVGAHRRLGRPWVDLHSPESIYIVIKPLISKGLQNIK